MGGSSQTHDHTARVRACLWRLASALCLAVLWVSSGWYSIGAYYEPRALICFDGGVLLVQVVQQANYYEPDFVEGTWEDDTAPPAGLVARDEFRLAWTLPSIHRVFESSVGTWWFIRIPLWLLVLGALIGPARCWFKSRSRCPANPGRASSPGDWAPYRRAAYRWLARFCAAVCVLVATTWVLSGFYSCMVSCYGEFTIAVARGNLTVSYDLGDITDQFLGRGPRWFLNRTDQLDHTRRFRLDWTPPHTATCAQSTQGTWKEVVIPFWFAFALAATAFVLLWRRARRLPPGHCRGCGYNLTGNVSGRCPECGRAVERARA